MRGNRHPARLQVGWRVTRLPETEAGRTAPRAIGEYQGGSTMCRFWAKVTIDSSGCWEWCGSKISTGYGNFWSHERVNVLAHRFAYTVMIGPIPVGLHIDHLCRNRACVNPSHLEAVTNRENSIRGIGPEATRRRWAEATHCPKGHEYSLDTVRFDSKGSRRCLVCARARLREWRARKRDAS